MSEKKELKRVGLVPTAQGLLRRGLLPLAVGISLGVLLGTLGGRFFGGADAGGTEPVALTEHPLARGELDALREDLEAEAGARTALAAEVERLQEQLALLVAELEAPGDASLGLASSDRRAAGEAPPAEKVETRGSALGRFVGEERPAFDEEGLLAVQVDPVEVGRLRERWEQFELEKLELSHSFAREGRGFSARNWREQKQLKQALREELGDEFYDLLLFATGQPNRVVVREVLDHSPARDAGLEPDDTILRYDATRIFAPGELRHASTLGESGEFVRIEVLREGRLREIYVPRGPLGILIKSESRTPAGS